MATSVTLKPNAIDISGSTSGTTTLQASAVAGTTTLTLPAATDTLVGKATTDTLTNKTLTGAAMNGTLGATTPSTASVTTLTTSSTVTHSGGTANGVAYLDGSKVLTTGSALVFDGSNLGLGVTPSAWGSGYKALQINNGGIVTNTGGTFTAVTANAYFDGTNYKYISTAAASLYRQNAGVHDWQIAASGTAGNAISFTQAMTLDASGNLGVGTTSPFADSGYTSIDVRGASTGSQINLGTTSTRVGQITCDTTNGITFNTTTATPLRFFTNGNEAARIDSSGNLLVGSTNSNGKLYVENASVTNTAKLWDTNGSTTSDGVLAVLASRNTTNNTFYAISYYNSGAGAYRFRVADSGNVTNTNNSYGAISDAKLKENIVDATPKLDGLMQVRVVNYNLKTNPEHKQLGVIAQELEQVFPALVDTSADIDEEGNDLGTTTKSVKYSVFIPMLIKAIQEQQAIITQLQADVAALKGA